MKLKTIASKIHSRLSDTMGRQIRKITLNQIDRRRLKRTDFSILSQNCVGSIWYHDLGLRFTSPTINMKFNANDWVDFLSDFDNNINLPITFIESDKPYPVGRFGNKYLCEFVHYHSGQEVLAHWDQRKKRLLPTKAVLAFDEGMDDEHIDRFLGMTQFPNRLLFMSEDRLNNKNEYQQSSVIIPVARRWGGAKLLNFSSLIGHRGYNRYIDYVTYLNQLE